MDGLLKIGTFSTLSGISVRMLRYYQDHGILKPAAVDAFSGHRFYTSDQVAEAHLVTQLRNTGCPVEAIAHVLTHREDVDAVAQLLQQQRNALNEQRDELHARFAALDRLACELQGRAALTEVGERTLPEMIVASLRRIVPTYGHESILWQQVEPLLEDAQVAFPAGGLTGTLFHDPEYRESDVDIEIWLQVAQPFPGAGPLQCTSMPEQHIVSAMLYGDYSQMPTATRAIGTYLAQHNLETGKMFNIYHVSPSQNPDPSSWVTEVCFPVVGA